MFESVGTKPVIETIQQAPMPSLIESIDSCLLGSDEPAPVLVWRNGGGSLDRDLPHYLRGYALCYESREAAIAGRAAWPREGESDEPFRVVLSEYVRQCTAPVAKLDASLNIVEVYQ